MRIMHGLGDLKYGLSTLEIMAYEISFTERTDEFDSPENIQIRDQFIKSINFLGNTTNTNTPGVGRFAE
jgi:hypothetical protein